MRHTVEEVREYWDSHLNLTQFLSEEETSLPPDELYRRLESSLDRYDYKKKLLERFAQGMQGRSLLEVGCGLGLELGWLGRLGYKVTGVDLAPRAVDLCNDYLGRLGVDGQAVAQNAEALEFPDDSFDAVYSSGVLQHTPNIEQAIGEVWRVLRPGGKILIILYHRHSWFYLLHRLSGINIEFASDDAPIINSYTRAELREMFGRFSDIAIETEYYYPLPTGRSGALPFLYNSVFVRLFRALPAGMVRRFGWHLVLTARKPA